MEIITTLVARLRAAVSVLLHGVYVRELDGAERDAALRLFR